MASSTFPATPSSRACCSAWRPSPVLLFISLRDAFSSGESGASFVSRSSSFAPRRHPLTQQIAHPRGNQLRVVGINQLQTVQRLAHQVFTIAGLAEAHLLQQMLLGRRRRRLR